MLSIFTIPKSFIGLTKQIQRNSIKSWLQLRPKCEIILCGDDYGVADVATEFRLMHVPYIKKNEFGTPLLSSAFDIVQKTATYETLVYANADIIIFQDMIQSIRKIHQPQFLVCGRRWDMDVQNAIDFGKPDWATVLQHRLRSQGQLHGASGIDYFIFARYTVHMPRFAVGRPGWDGWLIYEMRKKGIPVIDATETITIIHQNHDYSHSRFGEKKRVGGPELERNVQLAGGFSCLLTLRDADWRLNDNGLQRPPFPGRIFSVLSKFRVWRQVLSLKRRVQEGRQRNLFARAKRS